MKAVLDLTPESRRTKHAELDSHYGPGKIRIIDEVHGSQQQPGIRAVTLRRIIGLGVTRRVDDLLQTDADTLYAIAHQDMVQLRDRPRKIVRSRCPVDAQTGRIILIRRPFQRGNRVILTLDGPGSVRILQRRGHGGGRQRQHGSGSNGKSQSASHGHLCYARDREPPSTGKRVYVIFTTGIKVSTGLIPILKLARVMFQPHIPCGREGKKRARDCCRRETTSFFSKFLKLRHGRVRPIMTPQSRD
ncbi:Hypothetical protein GOX0058 [Gluconobacter oxydans 621H]|uniref:Uncharacterized protein n=1 Tax=Gluconobacter oxydans (strain 621H) TaxID=290633 RepID=Q5FUY9_GLUOX|nr:Hypothetical protein GOX0058 [Gluconobacter oxydans 621H]